MEGKYPGIRLTKQGRYEVTISHKLLPKGRVMRNFHEFNDGVRYKERMLELLAAGVVPPELLAGPSAQSPVEEEFHLSRVLREYLNEAPIAKSDRPLVQHLQETLQATMSQITNLWVDKWVLKLKREDRLVPSTIRKKVEALARAVDWWNRKRSNGGDLPTNPLRLLPRGYSTYRDGDLPEGEEIVTDVKRDRRLHHGEYEAIEAVIMGKQRPDRERPWANGDREDFLMLYRLIVHTAMRLREAYRLRVRDLKFSLRTIHIARSKTGPARDVPMTRQVEAWLKEYIERRETKDVVFPFWGGSDDEKVLAETTNRLSKRFSTLFEYTGCDDLREHDLRHEGTCRWMEMRDKEGRWLFRPEEVRRITGHKSVQMFERYLSLRGSDLADRLD